MKLLSALLVALIALDLLLPISAYADVSNIAHTGSLRRITLEVKPNGYSLNKLQEIGFKFELQSDNLIQGTIPETKLSELASLPFVLGYTFAEPAVQYALTNEAVNYTRANIAHSFGLAGKGIKVAVIDIGFEPSLIQFTQNVKEMRSFRFDGNIRAENPQHGVAVAEVLVGIAPDVELYLYNAETGTEFVNAVDFAIQRNVNIISTSVGFLNLGPYDGSSRPSRAMDKARSMGILPIAAAGNSGESHWAGKFKDDDRNNLHEFSGQDERNAVELMRGEPVDIKLSWDEWPFTAQDYDLLLTDSQGRIVAISANAQSGSQPPTESLKFTPSSSGTYYIEIRKTKASRDVNFDLFVAPNFIQYFVPEGSIVHVGDARGAITVGAISMPDDLIRPYSSRGPTKDGRIKPDLVAPDALTTSAFRSPFRGTSPSAPVVAGLAALLLSGNPTLAPDELQMLLERTAVDLGIRGKDGVYGSGRVNIKFPYLNSVPKVSSILVDGISYGPSELPKAFVWQFGSEHVFTIQSQNIDDGPRRYRFNGWSDGSSQPQRRITYDGSQEAISALFSGQYFLTIESPFGRPSGGGWYDGGSRAHFSVPAVVDHGNGTRRVFAGWEGDFMSKTANETLLVDGPKKIAAVWGTQFFVNIKTNGGDVEGGGWHDKGIIVILNARSSEKASNASRDVFIGWSGDVNDKASEVSVPVTKPIFAEASWKTQHYLKVVSSIGNPEGEGWHDQGAVVQFSIESRIGLLGEQVFDGWEGDSSARTPAASIVMDLPKIVTARWRADYSNIIIAVASVAAVLAIAFILRGRTKRVN